jgi:hypothetical protein
MLTTTSNQRSEAIRKYFTVTPIKPTEPTEPRFPKQEGKVKKATTFIIVGIVLCLTGVLAFFGAVCLWIGYSSFKESKQELEEKKKSYERNYRNYESDLRRYEKDYEAAEPKPSDEQIDEWMKEETDKITQQALERLGLDSDDCRTEPFVIGGPSEQTETKIKEGKDGKIRYSHINQLVVFLTEHNIATYQCDHSLSHGQTLNDTTKEFPYKEITSLETRTINREILMLGGKTLSATGFQQFALFTSGGNDIKVVYSFRQNQDFQGELAKIGSEDTISAIRKKLEEYKKKFGR